MSLHTSYTRPAKTLPRVAGHHADWLQACKGGTPASSNFDYGARLTEFVLLGALALRTGKTIKWDAANGKVANNVPEAQAIIAATTAGRGMPAYGRKLPTSLHPQAVGESAKRSQSRRQIVSPRGRMPRRPTTTASPAPARWVDRRSPKAEAATRGERQEIAERIGLILVGMAT